MKKKKKKVPIIHCQLLKDGLTTSLSGSHLSIALCYPTQSFCKANDGKDAFTAQLISIADIAICTVLIFTNVIFFFFFFVILIDKFNLNVGFSFFFFDNKIDNQVVVFLFIVLGVLDIVQHSAYTVS